MIPYEYVVPTELKDLISLFQSLTTLARRYTAYGRFAVEFRTRTSEVKAMELTDFLPTSNHVLFNLQGCEMDEKKD